MVHADPKLDVKRHSACSIRRISAHVSDHAVKAASRHYAFDPPEVVSKIVTTTPAMAGSSIRTGDVTKEVDGGLRSDWKDVPRHIGTMSRDITDVPGVVPEFTG